MASHGLQQTRARGSALPRPMADHEVFAEHADGYGRPFSVAQVDGRLRENYREHIDEIIAEHGLATLVQSHYVEAWMRCENPTLDALNDEQFADEASLAIACVMATTTQVSERLARSFGLEAV